MRLLFQCTEINVFITALNAFGALKVTMQANPQNYLWKPSPHGNIFFFLVKYCYPFICRSFCPMPVLMPISTVFLRAKIILQHWFLAEDSMVYHLHSHNLFYFQHDVLLSQILFLRQSHGHHLQLWNTGVHLSYIPVLF